MWTIFQGDALAVLRQLPGETVQTCVTSPPYWGLRDYGVEGQLGTEKDPAEYVDKMVAIFAEVRRVLRKDGTLWLNLGDCYVTEPHGRGDTHDPKWPGGRNRAGDAGGNRHVSFRRDRAVVGGERHRRPTWNLKHKDLVGMPWRVAFALQDDGWWLRRDIIWHKPNPMPESINDRPTSAHEYLFLFSRSGDSLYWTHEDGRGTRKRPRAEFYWRHRDTGETCDVKPANYAREEWLRVNRWTGHDYYYDADAIREPHTYGDHARNGVPDLEPIQAPGQDVQSGITRLRRRGNRNKVPAGWDTGETGHRDRVGRYRHHPGADPLPPQPGVEGAFHPAGRNRRSVWTIATQPFPEAHFATFPLDLVTPCIQAGTSAVGCCRACGAPRERKTVVQWQLGPVWNQHGGTLAGQDRGDDVRGRQFPKRYSPAHETRGWVPTCACPVAPVERCIVLDPFVGSGRTIIAALRLGRAAWGIDLKPDYVDMARRLIHSDAPLFNIGDEVDGSIPGGSPETVGRREVPGAVPSTAERA